MRITRYKSHSGAATTIMMVALFLVGVMFSSMAIDVGVYFNAQNMMQTAANAGAMAGIDKLVKSKQMSLSQKQSEAIEVAQNYVAENATVGMPFISDINDITFDTSNNANTMQVKVLRKEGKTGGQIPTLIANMVGISGTDATATAKAKANGRISSINGGVRPIYACDAQWKMALNLINQGLPSPRVRIYGDRFQIFQSNSWTDVTNGCPVPGSGNWGFADLRDGAPGTVGASTIGEWFANGYPGSVEVGKTYSTKPGNFIGSGPVSDALTTLINNKTEVFLPVVPIDKFTGQGSNTQVQPSAFVGFVFTNFKANGSSDSRYIEGYYVKKTCNASTCSTNTTASEGGVYKIQLVG